MVAAERSRITFPPQMSHSRVCLNVCRDPHLQGGLLIFTLPTFRLAQMNSGYNCGFRNRTWVRTKMAVPKQFEKGGLNTATSELWCGVAEGAPPSVHFNYYFTYYYLYLDCGYYIVGLFLPAFGAHPSATALFTHA